MRERYARGPLPAKARVSYVAFWFDGLGRQKTAIDYGTNGGSSFTRASSAASESRDATRQRTDTEYNPDGEAFKTTDTAGTIRTED